MVSSQLTAARGIIPTDEMPVTIPDEVLMAAHISEPELKQELALTTILFT